jgi:hypothetical protein
MIAPFASMTSLWRSRRIRRLILGSFLTPRSSNRDSASRKSVSEYDVDKILVTFELSATLPFKGDEIGEDIAIGNAVPGPDASLDGVSIALGYGAEAMAKVVRLETPKFVASEAQAAQ